MLHDNKYKSMMDADMQSQEVAARENEVKSKEKVDAANIKRKKIEAEAEIAVVEAKSKLLLKR